MQRWGVRICSMILRYCRAGLAMKGEEAECEIWLEGYSQVLGPPILPDFCWKAVPLDKVLSPSKCDTEGCVESFYHMVLHYPKSVSSMLDRALWDGPWIIHFYIKFWIRNDVGPGALLKKMDPAGGSIPPWEVRGLLCAQERRGYRKTEKSEQQKPILFLLTIVAISEVSHSCETEIDPSMDWPPYLHLRGTVMHGKAMEIHIIFP